MMEKKNRSRGDGIERLCRVPSGGARRPKRDWFRNVASASGLELFEAWFEGHAYDKHRHDTYAIGLTDLGVQVFDYRGAAQVSTAGKVIVLHPDEVHDGHAGSDEGFGYRILYVSPLRLFEAVRSLSSNAILPFVPDAVCSDPKLARVIASAFDHGRAPGLEPLANDSLILELAAGLLRNDPQAISGASFRNLDLPALKRARQFLDAAYDRVVSSSELEAVSGLSRYDLARQFRAACGSSPYRYSLARRLDFARCRLSSAGSLAELALEAGFADQAHFTRMFKSAHGITPARYVRLHASL